MFLSNDVVVVGCESPRAEVHSLIEKRELSSWECHQTRVRCMALIQSDNVTGCAGLLVTASSSDHMVRLWDVSSLLTADREAECVASVDTACRVTSLTVWHPGMTRANKKKKSRKVEDAVDKSFSPPSKKARDEVVIHEIEDSEIPENEVAELISKQNVKSLKKS